MALEELKKLLSKLETSQAKTHIVIDDILTKLHHIQGTIMKTKEDMRQWRTLLEKEGKEADEKQDQ
jgi:hypothetical protein